MKYYCRICLKEITNFNFVTHKTDEHSHIKMQLSICCPEMFVDFVEKPVFCKSCVSALHSAYNFRKLCLQTEKCILNFSRKVLSSNSININDLLYNLQQSAINGEGENTTKEGFAVTPNTNLLLSDEEHVSGQILNSESDTDQHSVTLPINAANNINNANNVMGKVFSKSAIETTADELNNLDDPLCITPIQSQLFKQENETQNEDITIKEENIAIPKVESPVSYEGFTDNLFEDAEREDHAAEVKSCNNKSANLQTSINTENCFVKLTRLPDDTVHKRYRFICKICKFTTGTKYYFKKHEAIHDKTKRFSCSWCTFHTVLKHSLVMHMRTHTGEKPFACHVCAFRVATKRNLQQHLRIHTGEKPFACNLCTYRSSQKSNLQQHLRTHTGEKPFACSVCNFRCGRRTSLRDHLRIHTGEKPFACNMCNFRSAQKSYLSRHLQIHSPEKAFSCNICNYHCLCKKDLIIHMKSHSADKVYTCSTCKYITVFKRSLSRHVKGHLSYK